jgi:acyl-CoA carboxylase subunit alpha
MAAANACEPPVDVVLSRVLVANRGEIARRVFRTCRDLGLATVAVYSDADARSPHIAEADVAVRLPGEIPADTYLRGELLVAAALRAGADAVHPGYGFLSENAAFAQAVLDAGLTWIGPPPAAIEAMGSKVQSKRLMAAAGVPVLPELAPDDLAESDLPVLIKASAGGGGRGMRIVRTLAELAGELAAATSEAASAFGDPTVFCEPYIESGRHIEVQVLADDHGTIWTVGERECSIQRRHQKIIEEAPSPLVQRLPGMRDELFAAARAAAAAVGYRSAGTVEFLADSGGKFYFLEMNTRLQVEHPVTECTTGLDLVALQLQIGAGRPLPPGSPPPVTGHAIEARLYAEDPAASWQPQIGTLHKFELPGTPAQFTVPAGAGFAGAAAPAGAAALARAAGLAGARLRLDSGVVSGSDIGVRYDPMLAKVISVAPDRDQAAAALSAALARTQIHGVTTNRDLLVRVLRHPAFLAGDTDTGFLDRLPLVAQDGGLAAPLAGDDAVALSALAAALADAAGRNASARVLGGLPSGWRNVPSQLQHKAFEWAGTQQAAAEPIPIDVGYRLERNGLIVDGRDDVTLESMAPDVIELTAAGIRYRFAVAAYPGLVCVDSPLGPVALRPVPRFADPAEQARPGSLLAPMPGTVARVGVGVGDWVARGQPLLWLEAMKMEHVIAAPAAGIVAELPVAPGQQVEVGSVLAVVKPEEEPQ